jgi:predicted dithiol-disulfide oxidoreductase (DUF899 family)
MSARPVVSHDEWIKARKSFLAREKAFTRERDALSRERRELPWEKVEKQYVFDGPKGKETLADLFAGKSQLIVYHFMFGADWQEGCPACSFWADNFNGIVAHLKQRDTTMVAISRALTKIGVRKRMGWSFKWLSSGGNDFNRTSSRVHARGGVNEKNTYNYTMQNPATGRRRERLFQGSRRQRVPHLLGLRARHRPREHRVQLSRPSAQGPRRERAASRLDPASRQVQGLSPR